ncbi:MAG TPA: hypothetical protein VFV92_14070 [Candidatus Bathyarchaeia archaeon]|nr:hypothetical protein [Candidatus Bathyarchaeia archaeon]
MPSEPDLHRGARIGTRIAMLVSQALVHTHTKLLDFKHKLAVMIFNTISNEISDEVDMTIGPLLKRMAADYDENGHVAALTHFMAHGRGQFKAIVGSSAAGQSLLWALGTVISNELAPSSYNLIGNNPHLIPDPSTIAAMVAGGHVDHDAGIRAIRENGLFDYWGNALIETARTWPAITDLTDWLNRHLISRAEYDAMAQAAGYSPNVSSAYVAAAFTEVSYQDAALAYLRGSISVAELYGIAQKQGVSSDDVDIYLSTIGEPPGTTDLLEGYRRGFIDQGTLQRGIKQSRTRDEWIPLIEQLRYSPMSIADAVNAAVQNHITQQQGEQYAQQNGLEPGHFQVLYDTAGAPLSRTELNDLYNRGVIGSDVVLQGLRESRLKDKYGADAFALRRRLLEARSLGPAVETGAMSHDVAIRKAMEQGYNAEDAAYLVNAASNRKMQTYRDKVVAHAEAYYADGAMSQDEFKSLVKSLGHSEQEAATIAWSADFAREHHIFTTAVNAIRSKYVAHHIDKGTASARLDGIGMQAQSRDHLIAVWELEASVNTKSLTEAQIIRAIKLGTITPDQGAERLLRMGYGVDDITIILADI